RELALAGGGRRRRSGALAAIVDRRQERPPAAGVDRREGDLGGELGAVEAAVHPREAGAAAGAGDLGPAIGDPLRALAAGLGRRREIDEAPTEERPSTVGAEDLEGPRVALRHHAALEEEERVAAGARDRPELARVVPFPAGAGEEGRAEA